MSHSLPRVSRVASCHANRLPESTRRGSGRALSGMPISPPRRSRLWLPTRAPQRCLPRLDWLMWFAALGDCRSSPWVDATQAALVEERPEVAALFAAKPFADGEVRAVRATRYRYRFAPRGAADWWMRAEVGPYCPAVAAVGVE